MKMKNLIYLGAITLLLSSCIKGKAVVNSNEYDSVLNQQSEVPEWLQADLAFWETKTNEQPAQFPYKAKLAAAYGATFAINKNIAALNQANELWEQVNNTTHNKTAGYLRAAAKQAITSHEFKKAYSLLNQAEKLGENLIATQKMLFDVHMELGQYTKAESYLEQIEDFSDVDYLIRKSKWEDYQGNLDQAITYLEQVLNYAIENKRTALNQWSYTNLGDYYGHAGRVQDAYQSYLAALKIEPGNKYAKKGIAYIAFAHDKNPKEAIRIINAISVKNRTPDDLLFLIELFEYQGEDLAKNIALGEFNALINSGNYGELYNIPLALLLAQEDNNYKAAIELMEHEVSRRATPETYDALAYVFLLSGNAKKALEIAKKHVIGKSEEPILLLHTASILKANNQVDMIPVLKAELETAKFELGPNTMKQVNAL